MEGLCASIFGSLGRRARIWKQNRVRASIWHKDIALELIDLGADIFAKATRRYGHIIFTKLQAVQAGARHKRIFP